MVAAHYRAEDKCAGGRSRSIGYKLESESCMKIDEDLLLKK